MTPTRRFDYHLPGELIAQTPSERRDGSRMLVVERSARRVAHRMFADLPSFLGRGDILFRNSAAVLPARLRGHRPTGGKVECLLLGKTEAPAGAAEVWQCLVRPGRRLPAGSSFELAGGALTGTVASDLGDGTVLVRFDTRSSESVVEVANRAGDVPLPPYIERKDDSRREQDRERYQTVYADPGRQVAVAAPTAGLHFTPDLLERIRAAGVRTADLTLHVGLGTFKPIAAETVEAHAMHAEAYEIPPETQRALFHSPGGRRIAVGTTAVRSIEDFLRHHDSPLAGVVRAQASLFIHPPASFRGVDALLTNFHQPRSTLLCLVAAFLAPGSTDGIDWLMQIYAEAVASRYRFLSYGDCMLIL